MIQQYISIRQGTSLLTYQILSDTVSNINYIGIAPTGSSQDDEWQISELTIADDGSVVSRFAIGSWNNRYILNYV